jgi:hypothetical protein
VSHCLSLLFILYLLSPYDLAIHAVDRYLLARKIAFEMLISLWVKQWCSFDSYMYIILEILVCIQSGLHQSWRQSTSCSEHWLGHADPNWCRTGLFCVSGLIRGFCCSDMMCSYPMVLTIIGTGRERSSASTSSSKGSDQHAIGWWGISSASKSQLIQKKN